MHGQRHAVGGNRSSPTGEDDVMPQPTHHYLVSYKAIGATVERAHRERQRYYVKTDMPDPRRAQASKVAKETSYMT